ncbi:MAG: TPR repeat [Marinobacter excellens HL-55]|uniref:TPR repeat n=1 Tax=Marinobacter excellens HL-55 TaxID=1305731 RepID=A0A0P8D386_9GAMM|nr:MAG: TPR repeat [Marinobacter excellens HL-55]
MSEPITRGMQAFLVMTVMGLGACVSAPPDPAPAEIRVQPVYSPEQAREWSQAGIQAHQSGDVEGAIEAWQRSVSLDPSNATTVNNLALLLKQQNRFHEAARLLEQGLAAAPEVAELHYNLAVISELYLLDLETALTHYQRYRSLVGDEEKLVAGWIADLERRLQ